MKPNGCALSRYKYCTHSYILIPRAHIHTDADARSPAVARCQPPRLYLVFRATTSSSLPRSRGIVILVADGYVVLHAVMTRNEAR